MSASDNTQRKRTIEKIVYQIRVLQGNTKALSPDELSFIAGTYDEVLKPIPTDRLAEAFGTYARATRNPHELTPQGLLSHYKTILRFESETRINAETYLQDVADRQAKL